MRKTVGYMLTWTTYGTWLQGEKKGFVKDGKVKGENVTLKKDCEDKLKGPPVRLRVIEKKIVREVILEAAKRFKQNIRAIEVCSNHVHIVCEYVEVPIGVLVGYYKNAGRKALQKCGYEGKVWTRGYDKRFCFNVKSLKNRIDYVEKHKG
ncbi:MAG: transposase [Planctomycetota bacterium]|jgi:REP element-mobilizing transposase RayT